MKKPKWKQSSQVLQPKARALLETAEQASGSMWLSLVTNEILRGQWPGEWYLGDLRAGLWEQSSQNMSRQVLWLIEEVQRCKLYADCTSILPLVLTQQSVWHRPQPVPGSTPHYTNIISWKQGISQTVKLCQYFTLSLSLSLSPPSSRATAICFAIQNTLLHILCLDISSLSVSWKPLKDKGTFGKSYYW
jgi:hypothetical protein